MKTPVCGRSLTDITCMDMHIGMGIDICMGICADMCMEMFICGACAARMHGWLDRRIALCPATNTTATGDRHGDRRRVQRQVLQQLQRWGTQTGTEMGTQMDMEKSEEASKC